MNHATTKRAGSARIDFGGRWENELGSTMDLTMDAAGRVHGRYRSAVGQRRAEDTFDLVGFASGDLLSFTVDFGREHSLAAWVGQHTEDERGEVLKTTWILARDVVDPAEPERLWSATLTGADAFRRR